MSHLRAIGLRFGAERRENTWYEANQPEALAGARARGLARAFSVHDEDDPVAQAMRAHQQDPFRGARIRYKLGPEETCLSLELDAARAALAAAGCDASDVDLILCASWLPENFVAPGNAVYHAQALKTRAAALNIETACSSGLACLELADSLLSTGRHRRVLVILSNTVSRQADDSNTLSWISSDVAAAALLEAGGPPLVAGVAMENTAQTCGSFIHQMTPSGDGPAVRMAVGPAGTASLREVGSPASIAALCGRALSAAGCQIGDIDLVACNTPLAWSAVLCQQALGASDHQMQDLFPLLGNAGLPFPLVHLHRATRAGRLQPGQRVLIYTIGSTSSSGAMVLTVGDLACG